MGLSIARVRQTLKKLRNKKKKKKKSLANWCLPGHCLRNPQMENLP